MSMKKRISRILRKSPPPSDTSATSSTSSSSSSSSDRNNALPRPGAITPVQSAPASNPPSRPGFQRHLNVVRTLTTWTSSRNQTSSPGSEKSSIWSRNNRPKKLSAKQKGKAPEKWTPGQYPEAKPFNEVNLEHQEILGRWSWGRAVRDVREGSVASGISPGTSDSLEEGSMRVRG